MLGGLLAILGGLLATWYQVKNVRKIKMEEIRAERKITANAQAYAYIKEIESSFIQNGPVATRNLVADREQWFFENRLFLPGKFPSKWLQTRNDIARQARWQLDGSKTSQEKEKLEQRIRDAITAAIDEIYKDMDEKRIEVE